MSQPAQAWPAADIQTLLILRQRGHGLDYIAAELGCSYDRVRDKLKALRAADTGRTAHRPKPVKPSVIGAPRACLGEGCKYKPREARMFCSPDKPSVNRICPNCRTMQVTHWMAA